MRHAHGLAEVGYASAYGLGLFKENTISTQQRSELDVKMEVSVPSVLLSVERASCRHVRCAPEKAMFRLQTKRADCFSHCLVFTCIRYPYSGLLRRVIEHRQESSTSSYSVQPSRARDAPVAWGILS